MIISIVTICMGLLLASEDTDLLSKQDAKLLKTYLPGVLIEPLNDDQGIESLETWWPEVKSEFQMERTAGGGGDVNFTAVCALTKRPLKKDPEQQPQTWCISLPENVHKFFRRTKDELVVTREIDIPNNVISTFDPYEPVIITGVKPGEQRKYDVEVKVYDLENPADLLHSGSLECTYRDLGNWKARVPAGEFEAKVISIQYRGHVGPAYLKYDTIIILGKHVGPIAWLNLDSISACLVYHHHDDYGCVLNEWKHHPDTPEDQPPKEE